MEHGTNLRYRKTTEVSEAAAVARSLLHKKARQLRSSGTRPSQPSTADKSQHESETSNQHREEDVKESPTSVSKHSVKVARQSTSGIPHKHLEKVHKCSRLIARMFNLALQAGTPNFSVIAHPCPYRHGLAQMGKRELSRDALS